MGYPNTTDAVDGLVGFLAGFDRKPAVRVQLRRITIKEVVVPPPEVFIPALADDEARRLKRRARSQALFTREREAILLASMSAIACRRSRRCG